MNMSSFIVYSSNPQQFHLVFFMEMSNIWWIKWDLYIFRNSFLKTLFFCEALAAPSGGQDPQVGNQSTILYFLKCINDDKIII